MKIIGIYARKSVYSDKSDSVQTQITLCNDYIERTYKEEGCETIIYNEDEGYSGANTNRPGFKKMLEDIEKKRVDIIICYKIDRISRDVKDFSNTFNFMQSHNVSFISVKEQIDTSTPLGRAMMYICSVFSQMERETIAERIKDNMTALAKSGKWAGGKPPLGYKRERTIINGKEHTMLVPDSDKIPFLEMIYNTFLEGYSLNSLATKFRREKIKTENGNTFTESQLYNILTNPHPVANTVEIWDYFHEKGCIMTDSREKFDGKNGLIVYGRTSGGKKTTHYKNTSDKWIVTTGLHKAIVSSEIWLKVQRRFGLNTINKTRKNEIGLLKGVLRCKCGWLMRTQHKVDKTYNKVYDNYFCSRRNTQGKDSCDAKFINVDILDNKIIEMLTSISIDKDIVKEYTEENTTQINTADEKNLIQKKIKDAEKKASSLAYALTSNQSSSAAKYIITEIEKIDKDITNYHSRMRELSIVEIDYKKETESLEQKFDSINDFIKQFKYLDYKEKNTFLLNFLKECVWDGETLHIKI